MWVSWHPPFVHNTQRLREKWPACEDLLGFTLWGPQEAIHVFRMTCETAQWVKQTVAGSRTSSLPARIQTLDLTCQLSNNQLSLSRRRAPPRRHRRLPPPPVEELRLPAEEHRLSAESFWFWPKGRRTEELSETSADVVWRSDTVSHCVGTYVTQSGQVKSVLPYLCFHFDLCTVCSDCACSETKALLEFRSSSASLILLRCWLC